MAQCVDLNHFVVNPGSSLIEVSARYLARTDCPSVFQLSAALYNERYERLDWFESPIQDAPADFWERLRHTFSPQPGARYVVIAIKGKDSNFWAGRFGSKVADCSVRVLYDATVSHNNVDHDHDTHDDDDDDDVSQVIHTAAFDNISEETVGPRDPVLRFFNIEIPPEPTARLFRLRQPSRYRHYFI